MKKSADNWIFLALSIVIGILAIRPLFISGYFPMHDDTQPSRVYVMANALREGQFPVRWVDGLGYGFGYPLFNFYAPLPYYIGAVFHIAGWDAIDSAKIMMGIGMILASVTMYALGQKIAGPMGGLLSSILYQFAPYHGVLLYVRGAVGELYAYAFLPLVILGMYEVVHKPLISFSKAGVRRLVILIAGLTGIFLSHTISAMVALYLMLFLLLGFIVLTIIKKTPVVFCYALLISLLVAGGLSSFFLLPAFLEKNQTKASTLIEGGSDYHNHFVQVWQLWESPWGFGGSTAGLQDGMSFRIGKIHLLAGAAGLIVLISYKKRWSWLLLIGGLISIFLTLEISKPIWQIVLNMAFIQYPWRFLTFCVFSLSLLSCGILQVKPIRLGVFVATVVTLAVLWGNLKLFQTQYIKPKDLSFYTDDISLSTTISKVSDEYMPYSFIPISDDSKLRQAKTGDENGNSISSITLLKRTAVERTYHVDITEQTKWKPAIAMFSGWVALRNGKALQIYNDMGEIVVNLVPGSYNLVLKLHITPLRAFANALSLLSLFLLVYGLFFLKIKSNVKR